MLPRSASCRFRRIKRMVALVAMLVAATSVEVIAHPMMIMFGEVRVVDDRLTLTIDISEKELAHLSVDSASRCVVDEIAQGLAYGIVALNDQGMSLEKAKGLPGGRAWKLSDDLQHVTLLMQPRRATAGIAPRQLFLRIFRERAEAPVGVVRLTGPEAAEVLDVVALRDTSEESATSVVFASEDLRIARLTLNVSENGVSAEMDLPAPVLDAWQLAPRADPNMLTKLELERQADALSIWMRDHVQLKIGGKLVSARAERPQWLQPGTRKLHDDQPNNPTTRCFWSARTRLKLVADPATAGAPVELTCSAFNTYVFAIEASVVCEGIPLLEGTLTAYAPTLEWQQVDAGTRVRVGQREIGGQAETHLQDGR